ncbi:hypothetical protein C7I55_17570 [Sphingomonas deserti]|nr:hypothetical protein C7I55_17570 [Sphingomonas deserti]
MSLPAPPSRVSLLTPPVIRLASALPMSVCPTLPVPVRFSRLSTRVKLDTLVRTSSMPAFAASMMLSRPSVR